MAILNNSNAISSGGYDINNSLRFRNSAGAYLSRTPSTGNRKTWTWSAWVKRGKLSYNYSVLFEASDGSGNNEFVISFMSGNILQITSYIGAYQLQLQTTQVFRDPSAWYHIVVALDTTQTTSSNRCKVYVNGNQITAFTTATYPSQNYDGYININQPHTIGYERTTSDSFDGYMAEVNFIDGSAKTPSDFGETDTTTGVWKPKAYSGTYGTNGFYLKFSDIATTSGSNAGLGKDFSGNSNYWTTNNISVTSGTTYDSMTDVPTNTSATVANYCVLNPTIANTTNLINANLTRNGAVRTNVASMVCTNGKYYFETTIQDSNGNGGVGVKQTTAYPLEGADTTKGATYFANGEYKIEGGTQTSGFSTYTNGDVIGIAIDTTLSTPKIWFAKNNTWQGTGDPTTAGYSLTSGLDYYFAILHTSSASSTTASANFGQRPFSYTPPTGYVALNTYNLPTSTIVKGNKYMDATTYTGTAANGNVITNAGGFKPDLVWTKGRSMNSNSNVVDSVRGTTKYIYTSLTDAEGTWTDKLVSFNSNGFTANSDQIGTGQINATNGGTYVAWQWQAGQGTTSSNTNGSITSTVSVNATAGFSIVTYTGNGVAGSKTIGHGLGVAPSMIILKDRDTASSGGPAGLNANDWFVWHSNFASVDYVIGLNSTLAKQTATGFWGSSVPSSTVFGINGSLNSVNENGDRYVAYCFAEIAGFSKAFSYTGNGSTDGPFVYTGFRPAFIMWKRTDTTSNWYIGDSKRLEYNSSLSPYEIYPNLSNAEGTGGSPIFLSNGFKLVISGSGYNALGGTYIGIAFAENPFKNALAR